MAWYGIPYLPVYNAHFFLSQILPLKSRCALYTEPFVFIHVGGNLHNIKNTKSNNLQFYEARRNK